MANNLIALEDYVTIRSAVRRSGYSEQYIRRLVRNRRLHAVKAGCTWLIEIASLDGYLKDAQRSNDKRRGPRRKVNGR
jgi:excisionase family DNA binding protein